MRCLQTSAVMSLHCGLKNTHWNECYSKAAYSKFAHLAAKCRKYVDYEYRVIGCLLERKSVKQLPQAVKYFLKYTTAFVIEGYATLQRSLSGYLNASVFPLILTTLCHESNQLSISLSTLSFSLSLLWVCFSSGNKADCNFVLLFRSS